MSSLPADNVEIEELEKAYSEKLPEDLLKIYSITSGGFVQIDEYDSWRLYNPKEIKGASDELHIDFINLRIMPIFDCKDNNFICFDFNSKKYRMYNIVTEMDFDEAEELSYFFLSKLPE